MEVQKQNLLAMWPVSFSMVLQTLQLFNSLHFAMLCAMQSILEQSKRGLANPTVSQLFLSPYFTMLSAVQSIPEHGKGGLANPKVHLFISPYFTMLSAGQNIPEHSK